MCMLRFHLSKEFSKQLTLHERETKEHNASACVNKITPGYSQLSWNAIKLNCNIANLIWESMMNLTLAETLHFNVILMWCSVHPALNIQVPLAWHPPCLHGQTLAAQVAFDNLLQYTYSNDTDRHGYLPPTYIQWICYQWGSPKCPPEHNKQENSRHLLDMTGKIEVFSRRASRSASRRWLAQVALIACFCFRVVHVAK